MRTMVLLLLVGVAVTFANAAPMNAQVAAKPTASAIADSTTLTTTGIAWIHPNQYLSTSGAWEQTTNRLHCC
ncbi:hypothetical protein V5799_018542 [Amblyomma americanum]|uniref:Secreted protein n=1 Tax=Amblyomma americanum TaxID=6943 RepID=A0AAQ4F044_AMBAM